MSIPVSVFDEIGKWQNATTLDELQQMFLAAIRSVGVENVMIGEMRPDPSRASYFLGTFPRAWLEHYTNCLYVYSDPVVINSFNTKIPFEWNQLTSKRVWGEKGLEVMNGARDFGLKEGFSIPIHMDNGYLAGVSFADEKFEASPEVKPLLFLYATFFHGMALDMLKDKDDQWNPPRLTPRERECLQWVAAGKSDWEISEIVNVSERTAHAHIENAKKKLGVHTRPHAVAEAIRTGNLSI